MIDFRYHLVSLVSVFLALAVGIVLGAGPLEGKLGDQLNLQVKQLATEKEDLRTRLQIAEGASAHRDTFLDEVGPSLVGQRLSGESVLVITLPGADTQTADSLSKALRTAGARLAGRVELDESWADPERVKDRESVLRSLQPLMASPASHAVPAGAVQVPAPTPSASVTASPVPGATSDSAALAGMLARATVTTDLGQTSTRDAVADKVLDGLRKGGLLRVDGELSGRATGVVVLAAGVPTADGEPPTATGAGGGDRLAQWSTLAIGLDARSDGVVVLGPASSATDGGLIATLRARDTPAGTVSTVDTGTTPMGDVSAVYALREQFLGGSGSYGFVGKVKAPIPVLGR